jgi:hypothetical protein
MLTLYENEIKKRWDQRAQIKNKFIFPRTSNHYEDKTIIDNV